MQRTLFVLREKKTIANIHKVTLSDNKAIFTCLSKLIRTKCNCLYLALILLTLNLNLNLKQPYFDFSNLTALVIHWYILNLNLNLKQLYFDFWIKKKTTVNNCLRLLTTVSGSVMALYFVTITRTNSGWPFSAAIWRGVRPIWKEDYRL